MKESELVIKYKHEMVVNPFPGMLVALEGLDGSGSSTQAKNLENYFSKELGIQTLLTREPTEGPIGAPILYALSRNLDIDNETLQMAFTTDRRDHLNNPRGIINSLNNNVLVITDRYLWSTIAYGQVTGLPVDWLLAMQSRFPIPDLTIYLKASVPTCLHRMEKTRSGMDLFEKTASLEKASQGYDYLLQRFPNHIIFIDGEQSKSEIAAQMINVITKHDKFKSLKLAKTSDS